MNRPNCPNCNGTNPISKGISWKCRVCGIIWIKNPRGKFVKDLGERPNCPNCNKPFPSSHGVGWLCMGCGKQWLKIKNPQKYLFYKDRPPCPYCGAYHSAKMGVNRFKCGECGKCYSEKTLQKNNSNERPLVIHNI